MKKGGEMLDRVKLVLAWPNRQTGIWHVLQYVIHVLTYLSCAVILTL